MSSPTKFESLAGGGDWAHAAEVFRKYDADGSGQLDRSELLAALRECDLLAGTISAAAAARALADMDTNKDGQVSFEEFREAYSRLAKLRAEAQRQARFRDQRAGPAVPPNAAVDPALRAAFAAFAGHGASRGLSDRTPRATPEGMGSRQFQRACAAAGVPLESGVLDVVFASLCAGRGRTLSFQRFLEALAQAAHESGVALEAVLERVRASAPTATANAACPPGSPAATTKGSPRSTQRPKSASPALCCKPSGGGAQQGQAAAKLHPAAPSPEPVGSFGGFGTPAYAPAPSPLNMLQQRVVTLQQLLEDGIERGDGFLGQQGLGQGATPAAAPMLGGASGQAAQQAQRGITGERMLPNPAYNRPTTDQGPEGGELASFRLDLLTLLDQRCEAAERTCAAMVATRGEMTAALVAQVTAALGGSGGGSSSAGAAAQEALAAVRGFEAQLGAADARLSGAVRNVAQECRAAVGGVQAQVDKLRRAQEEAQRQANEAILCIARRVGALAGQPQAG